MLNKITLLLFIILFPFFLGQKVKEIFIDVDKNLSTLANKPYSSTQEAFLRGPQLIRLAKTNTDKIFVYRYLADLKNKQEEYLEAIKFYEKAKYFARQENNNKEIFFINFFITQAYRYAGLLPKADEKWKIALNAVKDLSKNDIQIQGYIHQNEIQYLLLEKKYCEAIIPYKKIENITSIDPTEYDDYYKSTLFSSLSYSYLKCGKIDSGKIYLDKSEAIISAYTDKRKFYKIEVYYLSKGILSITENNNRNASIWLSKALKSAKSRKNSLMLKSIVEDALLYKVKFEDEIYEDLFLRTYINFNNKKTEESSKITFYELSKKDTEIVIRNNWLLILGIMLCIISAIIIIIIRTNNIRKRKIKQHFEEIIKNITLNNSLSNVEKETSKNIKEHSHIEADNNQKAPLNPSKSAMSIEKEDELLKKLNKFEKSEKFTAKNFTISQLATLLGTNVKYISFIIAEHHNKNFNEYINHLRIQFIIGKLYNDEKYRSYKISYLSELAGFANHSHFTKSFKKEHSILPSEFIYQLNTIKKN